MQVNLPKDAMMPVDFKFGGEVSEQQKELEEWLSRLSRSLEGYFKKAYYDISLGTVRRRIVSSEPALTDLGEGEIVLMDDEVSTRRIYTRMNGALWYTNLTAA